MTDDNTDSGLYQIYGRHIIFGPKSLLYVGMTMKTFGKRFDEHQKWLEEEEDVFIHVGRVIYDPAFEPERTDRTSAEWNKAIEDAEALTIKWHSPPYNSSNIARYNGQWLRVYNNGDLGRLKSRYDSSRRKMWGYP